MSNRSSRNRLSCMNDQLHEDSLTHLGCLLREQGYKFTTVTPLTQARVNSRPVNQWACDLAGVFGWSRPFRHGVLPDRMVGLMRDAGCIEQLADGWRSLLRATTHREHFFFHSAYPTTAADSVFFGPDTVRFVDAIHRFLASFEPSIEFAADIGCGAGPGGLAIATARPGSQVWNVDINQRALMLARVNARINGCPNVHTKFSDLAHQLDGRFDLIVSNPPYLIDPGERAYRHGGGMLGEGLSVKILEEAIGRLSPQGTLLLYTGAAIVNGRDNFREVCIEKLRGRPYNFSYCELDPDVFGEELETPAYESADRIAAVVLTVSNRTMQ